MSEVTVTVDQVTVVEVATALVASHSATDLWFDLDNGGSALVTGIARGFYRVDFNCTLQAISLIGDQPGSIVIDIAKADFASAIPSFPTNSIFAGSKPTLSASQKYTDTTLTGVTTSISAGDVFVFKIDSVSTLLNCSVNLKVLKS